MDELPKACVILGAGASADVHNGSSPILFQGKYKPPLARDLFAIDKHPEYFEVLGRYPGAQSLASVLSPLSDLPEFSLETKLKELAEHVDERVRQQFKHVPPYLRDLLWRSSYRYTPTPGTYLQLLYVLLADVPHNVLFLVLNYDTLLEQALSLFSSKMDFSNVESYVKQDQQAKVVKLHGSINWFKLIGGSGQSWDSLVSSSDVFQKIPDNEIYIDNSIAGPLTDALITGNRPYPILTAPLAGKKSESIVCPSSHIEAANGFLKDCRKFLIIGTSGLDDDLLSLLNSSVCIDPREGVLAHVVDVSEDSALGTLARFQEKVQFLEDAKVYDIGFKSYASEKLDTFAKHVPDDQD